MSRGGQILARVLEHLSEQAKAGVSLIRLDQTAEKLLKKYDSTPAFKGYRGFPYATCLSLNDEVVHGMPRYYRLKPGDILGIDIGVHYKGFYVDSAVTVGIGEITPQDESLIKVTYEALRSGIRAIRPGRKLGDIQSVIQNTIEKARFTIVRDLCGHGIGKLLQEEPQIPNYGRAGTGPVLQIGQTFALEPMVSFSSAYTATKSDGWTVVTLDGKRAAHFEHTIAVIEGGVEVLTKRQDEKF